MLYRNIKTGGLIVASAKFKGENWVAVEQSPIASEDPVDLPEEESEETEKPKRGRKRR